MTTLRDAIAWAILTKFRRPEYLTHEALSEEWARHADTWHALADAVLIALRDHQPALLAYLNEKGLITGAWTEVAFDDLPGFVQDHLVWAAQFMDRHVQVAWEAWQASDKKPSP